MNAALLNQIQGGCSSHANVLGPTDIALQPVKA